MENIFNVTRLNFCLEIKGRKKMNKKKIRCVEKQAMMIRRNKNAYAVIGVNTTGSIG